MKDRFYKGEEIVGASIMIHLYAMKINETHQVLLIGSTRERWRGGEEVFQSLDEQALRRRAEAFTLDEIKTVAKKRKPFSDNVTDRLKEDKEQRDRARKEAKEKRDQFKRTEGLRNRDQGRIQLQGQVKKEDTKPKGQHKGREFARNIFMRVADTKRDDVVKKGDRGLSVALQFPEMIMRNRCFWCLMSFVYPNESEYERSYESIIGATTSRLTSYEEKKLTVREDIAPRTFEAEAIGCAEADTFIQESRLEADTKAHGPLLIPMSLDQASEPLSNEIPKPGTDGGSYECFSSKGRTPASTGLDESLD